VGEGLDAYCPQPSTCHRKPQKEGLTGKLALKVDTNTPDRHPQAEQGVSATPPGRDLFANFPASVRLAEQGADLLFQTD